MKTIKKLKMVFVFLFAVAITGKLFAQDTTLYVNSYQIAYHNLNSKNYLCKPRVYNDLVIKKEGNKIMFNDYFNSVYTINETDSIDATFGKSEVYTCKDLDGVVCLFYRAMDTDTKEFCYVVEYSDVLFFYYTKI